MLLGDALGYPDYVSTFLLLQLEVRVEDAKMKLLHERIDVQFDFVLEEFVFKRLVLGIRLRFKQKTIIGVHFSHRTNLLIIVSIGQ